MTLDILMPFYGDVGHFRVAVESVLAQDDGNWRLVVIDDRYPSSAHTDYLATVDDPRVEYVLNVRNLGVSGNFQRAVDLAVAEFCVIMGCDDVLLPDFVGRVRAVARQRPAADVIQPGVRVIDGSGRPSRPLADRVKEFLRPSRRFEAVLTGEDLAASLLRGAWTYFPSIAWRADTLRRHGFRPEFGVVLDLALLIEIAVDGGTLIADTETTFLYRRHAASVSSALAVDGRRFDEEGAFFAEAAARCDALGWRRAARIARRHVSSRLNALTRVPAALRRDRAGLWRILRYAVARG